MKKTIAAFAYAVTGRDGVVSTGDEIDIEVVSENDVVRVERSARFEQLLRARDRGAISLDQSIVKLAGVTPPSI